MKKPKVLKFDLTPQPQHRQSMPTLDPQPTDHRLKRFTSCIDDQPQIFPQVDPHTSSQLTKTETPQKPLNRVFIDRKLRAIEEISSNLLQEFDKVRTSIPSKTQAPLSKNNENNFEPNIFAKNVEQRSFRPITESKEYWKLVDSINKKWRKKEYKKRFKVE